MAQKAQCRFVGYIRVSTQQQANGGDGLGQQAQLIRTYANQHAGGLCGIYEDVGSAAGHRSALRLPGLASAIADAKRAGASLLVTDPSRISRNAQSLKMMELSGIKVINVMTGRSLDMRRLREKVQDRAAVARKIQRASAAAVSAAKLRGALPGNRKNLRAAQRRGSVANAVRAGEKYSKLADALEGIPGWQTLPRKKLVDALNATGSRNILRKDEPAGELWRISTLRQPLEKAIEELEFRNEMALEVDYRADVEMPSVGRDDPDPAKADSAVAVPDSIADPTVRGVEAIPTASPDAVEPLGRVAVARDRHAEDLEAAAADDANPAYRDNPLYGRFY